MLTIVAVDVVRLHNLRSRWGMKTRSGAALGLRYACRLSERLCSAAPRSAGEYSVADGRTDANVLGCSCGATLSGATPSSKAFVTQT